MIYSKIDRSVLSQKLDAKISRVQAAEAQKFNRYVDNLINEANVRLAKVPFKYRLPWSEEYLPEFITFTGTRIDSIHRLTAETLPENYNRVFESCEKALGQETFLDQRICRATYYLNKSRYAEANEECRRIRLMILETIGDIEIDQDTMAFLEGNRKV